VGECVRFDAVDKLDGISVFGDEVKAAAGEDLAGAQAQDSRGDGVVLLEIIEEPAAAAGVLKGFLNSGKGKGGQGWASAAVCF
jgi:hypothetical protein